MARQSQVNRKPGARPRRKQARRSRLSGGVLWGIIVVAVLAVVAIVVVNARPAPTQAAVAVQAGQGMAWGPANAPVQIVEYGNFGCPHCQDFALNQEQQLRADFQSSGQVHFEFKPFRLADPSADQAANAAMCAADQGKFWQYHDLLYQQMSQSANPFSPQALKQYGAQLGLNTAQFDQCVDNSTHLSQVYQDSQQGTAQGVTGTPTFFINGQMIEGAVPYADFKQQIDNALKARS